MNKDKNNKYAEEALDNLKQKIKSIAPLPILTIDDSGIARKKIKLLLKDDGYFTIYEAENGVKGLMQLGAHPEIKIIFLDYEMPVLDGRSFFELFKAAEEHLSRKVIMVTSVAQKENVIQALRLGIYSYILKPFNHLEVVKNLTRAIESLIDIQDNDHNSENDKNKKTTSVSKKSQPTSEEIIELEIDENVNYYLTKDKSINKNLYKLYVMEQQFKIKIIEEFIKYIEDSNFGFFSFEDFLSHLKNSNFYYEQGNEVTEGFHKDAFIKIYDDDPELFDKIFNLLYDNTNQKIEEFRKKPKSIIYGYLLLYAIKIVIDEINKKYYEEFVEISQQLLKSNMSKEKQSKHCSRLMNNWKKDLKIDIANLKNLSLKMKSEHITEVINNG